MVWSLSLRLKNSVPICNTTTQRACVPWAPSFFDSHAHQRNTLASLTWPLTNTAQCLLLHSSSSSSSTLSFAACSSATQFLSPPTSQSQILLPLFFLPLSLTPPRRPSSSSLLHADPHPVPSWLASATYFSSPACQSQFTPLRPRPHWSWTLQTLTLEPTFASPCSLLFFLHHLSSSSRHYLLRPKSLPHQFHSLRPRSILLHHTRSTLT